MADNVQQRLRPALFLDRDGTIIEDVGDLGEPSQVRFIAGVFSVLGVLKEHFALFIVTNQSAVSKGNLTRAQVDAVNTHVVESFDGAGIPIERVFVCPHARTDNCSCIKPKPHFLRVAEREHGIDLVRSYAIGDHPHDVEFAHSVGATGLYVLTGHGMRHRELLKRDCIVIDSLADAASVILPHQPGAATGAVHALDKPSAETAPSARSCRKY